MLEIEKSIWEQGYKYIACIDEVGRGCLAGSVLACAIIMPRDLLIEGVDDSKKLTPKKREDLFEKIKQASIAIGIGEVSCQVIDEINIKNATLLAMKEAVNNLKDSENNKIVPDYLLIDAEKLNLNIPQKNIIQGDAKCHGIAAASIIAKVTRDRIMDELSCLYPHYKFSKNKGYGTKKHIEALLQYGATDIHRESFLTKILNLNEQLSI